MKNSQLSFLAPVVGTLAPKPSRLPWREWYSGVGSTAGTASADKSAAVAVLHSLHINFPVDAEPVDVMQLAGKHFVIATRQVKACEIKLPPCVPRQSQVWDHSENPFAVEMKVSFTLQAHQIAQQPAAGLTRSKTFFLNPEFKAPREKNRTGRSRGGSARG